MPEFERQKSDTYAEYPRFLPDLSYWEFLPGTEKNYVIGLDPDNRIQVYSLKRSPKQLSQEKRRQGYYVRLKINGKRTWRSVKKLYRSIRPHDSTPANFSTTEGQDDLARKEELKKALKHDERWGYPLVEGVIELKQYAVTTLSRVFSLKGGRVTEIAQTIDNNGARVRLYYDEKETRPYVHTLVRGVFGDPRSCDPRKTIAGAEQKMSDLEYWAHLSIYENGRKEDWNGIRDEYVKEYGRDAVLQAEAKSPQFTSSTGY